MKKAFLENEIRINYELLSKIRELALHPWYLSTFNQKQNLIHASLDTIRDTSGAISYYLKSNFSNENSYFYICGILQVLFIQQDTINFLQEFLLQKDKIDFKDYPSLYKIRESRNHLGHPIFRNKKTFHTLFPNPSKEAFQIISILPNQEDPNYAIEMIDLFSLLLDHQNFICKQLEAMEEKLKFNLANHKLQFKNKKCMDLISEYPPLSQIIRSLFERVHNNYPAKADFEIFYTDYEKIKLALKERYGGFFPQGGELIEFLDYLFARLKRDLIDKKIADEKELFVFVFALEQKWQEFLTILSQVDQEFE